MRASIKVLAIYREEKYSNRAVDFDKAIMDEVLKYLIFILGNEIVVTTIKPEDIGNKLLDFNYDLAFSMAQDDNILAYLELLEERGTVVLNNSKSIRNCFRSKLSKLLCDPIFSYPRYISLNVEQKIYETFNSIHGFWVKRSDFHSLCDDDVVHINNIEELNPILLNFKSRGVNEVILQESIDGDLYKFYGIKDQYFNCNFVGRTNKDRYTNISSDPNTSFDRNSLEAIANKAAHTLDLDFYGGDFIITPTNEICIIDFNDWPSFRTCRSKVAPIMGMYALDKIKAEVNSALSINK